MVGRHSGRNRNRSASPDVLSNPEAAITDLELLVGEQGLTDVRCRRNARLHLDIDSTVEALFGTQEGALPGPNPHYHGRPSYHPLLAAVAETGTVIGAELRPGDTRFGDDQADFVGRCIDRLRARHRSAILCVRIDAAGDCAALMKAIATRDAYFFIKGKMERALCDRITLHSPWQTVDVDAHGHAITQIAEIYFMRESWALPAFVLSTRARPSYRPWPDATKFPAPRSSGRGSPGSKWPVTPRGKVPLRPTQRATARPA